MLKPKSHSRFWSLTALLLLWLVACSKKKEQAGQQTERRIAYAIYQTGLYDTVDAKKVSEWLNRGEMVTVLEEVNQPDPKDPKKNKTWAKIQRTTDKVGYVDPKHLAAKAFVVLAPLDVFNINQVAGKKRGTVLPGQVGFVTEEKAGWAKVRFGYKVFQSWNDLSQTAWVDDGWAQLTQVSYDPAIIGQALELETALRNFSSNDNEKKQRAQKELEKIVSEGSSQFVDVARQVLESNQPQAVPEATEIEP